MTADERALLNAILAAPADDLPRLVYADWLEERGDPRHELIRVCQAMREVPVWSDRYWELKARRNELWELCPIEWLEATGYDGGYYDPIFRDGVPGGWRERWRLIREFTERWHGVAVPDMGGRREDVRQAEAQLGLRLPPSVREYVAYSHDVGADWIATPDHRENLPLFHCAHYQLDRLSSHPAVSLIYYTLDDSVLGVAEGDLAEDDPPAYFFSQRPPDLVAPSSSLAIFSDFFLELPTAGSMATTLANAGDRLARLTDDFPIHAKWDGADVYESSELLVLVGGVSNRYGHRLGRRMEAIVRRPVPIESIPDYLFGTGDDHARLSGMLGPEDFRRQQTEEHRRRGVQWPLRWRSVLRQREAERTREVQSPLPQDTPRTYETDDDIPF